jgi:hypothetical protein
MEENRAISAEVIGWSKRSKYRSVRRISCENAEGGMGDAEHMRLTTET